MKSMAGFVFIQFDCVLLRNFGNKINNKDKMGKKVAYNSVVENFFSFIHISLISISPGKQYKWYL